MLSLCGYNFCADKNALDFIPTNVNNIKNVQLQNGIYDHFNVNRNVSFAYDNNIPTKWDFFTLMDANFNGNIYAGNVKNFENVTSILVKRRIKGEYDWFTLTEVPINTDEDVKFSFNDHLNGSGIDYEYALVPKLNDIESNYIVEEIHSEFNGIFICDANEIYKFYADATYGDTESVQKVGVYETVGSKYPIIVSNGAIDYHNGSINARIMTDDYLDTRKINAQAMVKTQRVIDKFFKKKRAKILKDFYGNIWLIYLTGNPSVSYDNNGTGMMRVTADWTEQGNANDGKDLTRNGFVKVVK